MVSIHSSQTIKPHHYDRAKLALASFYKRGDVGFHSVYKQDELFLEAQKRAVELRSKYKKMVFVGIGGSILGAQAIHDLFAVPKASHQILFCDNVDPWELEKCLQIIESNLSEVAFVFASKSGTTLETLTLLECLLQWSKQKNYDIRPHCTVISEKRSNPLSDWARQHRIPILEIPENVGGRYSVLTAVGMLPAGFLGLEVEGFRRGAQQAAESIEVIEKITSMALESFERQLWISFFWFYCSRMRTLGLWLEQLWAESLAKKNNHNGMSAARVSTPVSAVGAIDQHSLLQQLVEGAQDKWVLFIRNKQSEQGPFSLEAPEISVSSYLKGKSLGQVLTAEAEATERALSEMGIYTANLTINELNETSVGFFLMQWQIIVACIGEALNINAFDQPGVELGKRLAKGLLQS